MSWSVSKAKAELSEVLARARRSPQVIENRGTAVAVVVSKAEFDRLQAIQATPRPTALEDLLELTSKLKAEGDLGFGIPPRELEADRPIPFADD